MVAVCARAEKERDGTGGNVPPGERAERALDLDLSGMIGQIEHRIAGRLGHVPEEAVHGRGADRGQHRPAVGIGQRQIAHRSTSRIGQRVETKLS